MFHVKHGGHLPSGMFHVKQLLLFVSYYLPHCCRSTLWQFYHIHQYCYHCVNYVPVKFSCIHVHISIFLHCYAISSLLCKMHNSYCISPGDKKYFTVIVHNTFSSAVEKCCHTVQSMALFLPLFCVVLSLFFCHSKVTNKYINQIAHFYAPFLVFVVGFFVLICFFIFLAWSI